MKEGLTFWLMFSTLAAVFGTSLLFGYNIAVLNTPDTIIQAFYNRTYYERGGEYMDKKALELLWAVTVAIYVGIGMIGAFTTSFVADKFGRKGGLMFNHTFALIGTLLEGLCKVTAAPELLIVGRGFVGFNCGMTVGMVSLYITELAPKELRGAIGACHQMATTIGISLAQILGLREMIGGEELWPLLVAFCGIPALISLLCLPFCPESPRFLLLNKKDEEAATKALQRLRNHDDVSADINEMKVEAADAAKRAKFAYIDLFRHPELRMPVLISVIIQVAQQWSGINAVFFYAAKIFRNAGVDDDKVPYAIIGTGIINVLATIVSMPLIERLGRRPLLIWPMGLMGISCIAITISLSLQDTYAWMAYISIIFVLVYVIGFALGLGPIPQFVVAELFRQEPRAAVIGLAQFVNWTCNFILALTFPFLQEGLQEYTFLLFLVIIVACIVFLAFFLPETKNKTFEEIATHMRTLGKTSEVPPTNKEEESNL
ncbi:solute carrier family 2, facilitated glucose transporter member 1 [Lingula anatina]|uniref:Solute carrier family 2, facilitated glucose transporter member 1 n=1 Tax=Lingula anatina TaxID=7574 RepID=A0A1S3JNR3_LINAN|nr:solute carrier family 2, facilitated glucose transporter member 1 [Lingula anatina]|eukprot:XP_013412015.1 solute carrier family 2, facilitated glucose transporter member 1 [Lingula anatina]